MDIGNPPFQTPFGACQVHTEDYYYNYIIIYYNKCKTTHVTGLAVAAFLAYALWFAVGDLVCRSCFWSISGMYYFLFPALVL
jgi:hypothetical protein